MSTEKMAPLNRGRGRPEVDSEPVKVRLQRNDLNNVDHWRQAQPDQPNRPEAIRRLVRKALDREH
jgi:hypothetical protein